MESCEKQDSGVEVSVSVSGTSLIGYGIVGTSFFSEAMFSFSFFLESENGE